MFGMDVGRIWNKPKRLNKVSVAGAEQSWLYAPYVCNRLRLEVPGFYASRRASVRMAGSRPFL